jgi:hypothetical protein
LTISHSPEIAFGEGCAALLAEVMLQWVGSLTIFIWAVEHCRVIFHSLGTDQQLTFSSTALAADPLDRSYFLNWIYPALDYNLSLQMKRLLHFEEQVNNLSVKISHTSNLRFSSKYLYNSPLLKILP